MDLDKPPHKSREKTKPTRPDGNSRNQYTPSPPRARKGPEKAAPGLPGARMRAALTRESNDPTFVSQREKQPTKRYSPTEAKTQP